jgi:hypothetical protein
LHQLTQQRRTVSTRGPAPWKGADRWGSVSAGGLRPFEALNRDSRDKPKNDALGGARGAERPEVNAARTGLSA